MVRRANAGLLHSSEIELNMIQSDLKFTVSAGKRIMMLVCTWIMCAIIFSLIYGLLTMSGLSAIKLRIAMTLQDILVFVLPAAITAVVVSRRAAQMLMLLKRPGMINIIIVFMILIASMPLMAFIIDWNQHITLPEQLSDVEQWMRDAETSASESMSLVMGKSSVGALVINIMLIGIMAAFSEELFFRGALQRILATSSVGRHAAIWITALVFSAAHMQFLGFFPRLILGVFFGYLALWSGSLWLAFAGHALNNTIAVILTWIKDRTAGACDIDAAATAMTADNVAILVFSAALTALWVWLLWRRLNGGRAEADN